MFLNENKNNTFHDIDTEAILSLLFTHFEAKENTYIKNIPSSILRTTKGFKKYDIVITLLSES